MFYPIVYQKQHGDVCVRVYLNGIMNLSAILSNGEYHMERYMYYSVNEALSRFAELDAELCIEYAEECEEYDE